MQFIVRTTPVLLLLALSACGGGGSDDTAAAAQNGSAANSASSTANVAPTLTGYPATGALIGTPYSFTPHASDANGEALTFSIQNQPAWATFDPATGQLVGSPDAEGVSADVTISVSNGRATTTLSPFSIAVTATGGSAQVSWSPPTDNNDGTALADLAGYHVYFGTDPTELEYVDVQGAASVSYTATNLPLGTYYFTVTAYNAAGVESVTPAVTSTVIG